MGTKLFSTFYFDCVLLLNLLIEIQKERREKREKKRKEKNRKEKYRDYHYVQVIFKRRLTWRWFHVAFVMYIIGVQKHFANDVYFDFVKLRRFKSNYGPISLISCFRKVFASIINNILASYADQEQFISESQAGFRRMHSTTYTIFILHSLVNLWFKPLDKVNRSCCWLKMLKSYFSGNTMKNKKIPHYR